MRQMDYQITLLEIEEAVDRLALRALGHAAHMRAAQQLPGGQYKHASGEDLETIEQLANDYRKALCLRSRC